MECPDCGRPTVVFPLTDEFAGFLPGDEDGAAICTHCLAVHPVDDPPGEPPDFDAMGDAYPNDPAAGVPMALVLGLLTSIALYRDEIAELTERVERAGTDPLLVLDRLADDPEIDSRVDLYRRRRQLAALV